jgi:hypothetical protein
MMDRENLIKSIEQYLRRKLTDAEIQEMYHAADCFKFDTNDALWTVIGVLKASEYSISQILEDHEQRLNQIPAEIRQASLDERLTIQNAGELAGQEVQLEVSKVVNSLVPSIRSAVSKAAGTQVRRFQLGQGMLSIGAGGLIASGLIVLGVVLGTGIEAQLIRNPKIINDYWNILGWNIQIAVACPVIFGFGIYALEADYSTESKLAGWLGILVSVGSFVVIILKVLGVVK